MRSIYHAGKGDTESPGKMAARAWAYSRLSRHTLYTKEHIVIASRQCGDVKLLLNYGVNHNNITAVDIDPKAVRIANDLGVCAIESDIQTTIEFMYDENMLSRIGSINIDLCDSLGGGLPTFNSVLDILRSRRNSAHIFFTFSRGRDGFQNDQERINHLKKVCRLRDFETFLYTSWNSKKLGFPMCTVSIPRA